MPFKLDLDISFIEWVNYIIGILFCICYFYQVLYVAVLFIKKDKPHKQSKLHRYAFLISARNEEKVIANLIKSIRQQDYPSELIDIFVVADNCTDLTAQIARDAGAVVWERFDTKNVGKGFALNFLIKKITETFPEDYFDGYFVFDADNVLSEDYVTEMNKSFSDGFKVVTSYRNATNFGSNWISGGYGIWFMREAEYLNHPRMLLNTSCAVSGTGFLFSNDILKKMGGWDFFLLTEDIEFTIYNIINRERIGYCSTAIFYDEQPTSFAQSCRQRMRWAKGYLQVFGKYGGKLVKSLFTRHNFAAFDMTMSTIPAMVITTVGVVANSVAAIIGLLDGGQFLIALFSLLQMLINTYLTFFVMGALTTFSEWKRIHASTGRKVLNIFTFPIFMFTYIPISFIAIFKKVEWKPIYHRESRTLEEIRDPSKSSVTANE